MHAVRILEIATRKGLVEHDVGRESGAPVDALEEVVADERVLRNAAFEAPGEGGDVVDPLPDVDAASHEVLVDVGDGPAVDVDRRVAGEETDESGAALGDGLDLDARLDDRVAAHHASGCFVEARAVERMGHGADEAPDHALGQLRVGVERDHEADVADPALVARLLAEHREGGVGGAEDEAVELLELAPLALPPHPTAFRAVVAARPMERVERARPLARVVLVQASHAGGERIEDRGVARHPLRFRVGEVGQQHELDGRLRIAEIVGLELLQQVVDLVDAAREAGDDHGGREVRRNAVLEIELRQHARRDELRDRPVHDGHPEDRGGDRHHRDRQQPGSETDAERCEKDRRRDQCARDRRDQRGGVEAPSPSHQGTSQSQLHRNAIAERGLERLEAFVDQPVADVGALAVDREEGTGLRDHPIRDLRVGQARRPSELLDDTAVAIRRLEVHPRIHARWIALEDRLDRAGLAEEVLPGDRRDDAQVAQRASDALGLVQAGMGRIGHVERRGNRWYEPLDGGSEDLDAGHAEHGRQCPQLGRRQERGLLVGVDEARDGPPRELEMRGLEQAAGQIEHTRNAAPRGGGQRRELLVEALREVLLDLEDRALDPILVVEEPLGRLRRTALGRGEGLPRARQPGLRVADPRPGRHGIRRAIREHVSSCELVGRDVQGQLEPGRLGLCAHDASEVPERPSATRRTAVGWTRSAAWWAPRARSTRIGAVVCTRAYSATQPHVDPRWPVAPCADITTRSGSSSRTSSSSCARALPSPDVCRRIRLDGTADRALIRSR
jgi:hypothetical protein